jgi:hypothetical protein
MFVAIPALLLVLIAVVLAGVYKARHRTVEPETPLSNLRPDDLEPTADPDLTNPPISQPELQREPWTGPTHRL